MVAPVQKATQALQPNIEPLGPPPLDRPVPGHAHVVQVGLDFRQRIELSGTFQVPRPPIQGGGKIGCVPVTGRLNLFLPGSLQPLRRVLAHRLQHREARSAGLLADLDEVLVHQGFQ